MNKLNNVIAHILESTGVPSVKDIKNLSNKDDIDILFGYSNIGFGRQSTAFKIKEGVLKVGFDDAYKKICNLLF